MLFIFEMELHQVAHKTFDFFLHYYVSYDALNLIYWHLSHIECPLQNTNKLELMPFMTAIDDIGRDFIRKDCRRVQDAISSSQILRAILSTQCLYVDTTRYYTYILQYMYILGVAGLDWKPMRTYIFNICIGTYKRPILSRSRQEVTNIINIVLWSKHVLV